MQIDLTDKVAIVTGASRGIGKAIANAGTNPHFGPTLEASVALWDKIMEVNLRGAFLLSRAVVPHMRPGGKLVIMSSVAGFRPSRGLGIYSVSKAALNMLTQVLATELGSEEIRVNAIAPGTIKTRFSKVLYETKEIADRLLGRTPLGYLVSRKTWSARRCSWPRRSPTTSAGRC